MTPRFRSLLTALFAASLAPLILVDAASGQAAGAGLQMLQGLTPEQREAILRQLGGGGGEIPGGTQGTSTGRQEQADEELLNFTNHDRPNPDASAPTISPPPASTAEQPPATQGS